MEICEGLFPRKVITPGVTTTTEVVEDCPGNKPSGLTFWFSPHGRTAAGVGRRRQRRELIQHGDLLHYDVGIKYFWVVFRQPAAGLCAAGE